MSARDRTTTYRGSLFLLSSFLHFILPPYNAKQRMHHCIPSEYMKYLFALLLFAFYCCGQLVDNTMEVYSHVYTNDGILCDVAALLQSYLVSESVISVSVLLRASPSHTFKRARGRKEQRDPLYCEDLLQSRIDMRCHSQNVKIEVATVPLEFHRPSTLDEDAHGIFEV